MEQARLQSDDRRITRRVLLKLYLYGYLNRIHSTMSARSSSAYREHD